MERRLCSINESGICKTMHVLNFDENVEGDGGSQLGVFAYESIEGVDGTSQRSFNNDDEEDTQTSTKVRLFI